MDVPVRVGAHYVRERAQVAASRRVTFDESDVWVIAVSKTKPKSAVIEAYEIGQCDFGENYVAELVQKATDPEVVEKCPDIKWHFIGHLQSNKVNRLMTAPNLYLIHTIDSVKLADLVDAAWGKLQKPNRLKVMVQINISEECNKSGVSPKESHDLAKHILDNCRNLKFHGLMIIGSPDHDPDSGPNPEFKQLLDIKHIMCDEFNIPRDKLYLSMGMSHDFEHAIGMGSNYVRVGTAIFGAREKKA